MEIFHQYTNRYEQLTSNISNTSVHNYLALDSIYLGVVCLAVSSIATGITYLPLKYYDIGDGLFYQFVVAIGMMSSSLLIDGVRGFPQFYALPMLGGALWAFGNLNTALMVDLLGIGLSSFISNSVCLIVGWANARFGWFGVSAEVPSDIALNNTSVVICIFTIMLGLFIDIDSSHKNRISVTLAEDQRPLINESRESYSDYNSINQEPIVVYSSTATRLSKTKWLIGISSSVVSGIGFGLSNTPVLYVMDNYAGASQNMNDFTFSFSCGILLCSCFFFVVYSLMLNNKPWISNEIFLPSLLTGFIWTISNATLFLAINVLTQSVTFPISNCVPSVITLLIGVAFKEIRGLKNLILLAVICVMTILGSVLCGLSK